jgi:hypothetical protein
MLQKIDSISENLLDPVLVIASDAVQAPNDKEQHEPVICRSAALPEGWGKPERCSPITAISARPMYTRAPRQRSNR